jgi:pyruvate formate lyase activating enzyme
MNTRAATLEELLDSLTVEGELYERLEGEALRCYACGHRCLIRAGRRGICKVRFNAGGRLKVPFGYVGALQCDPTEKKPFFHVLPGSDTLTFGMLGCDFHCPYCQNWLTSQALRDKDAVIEPALTTPQRLVDLARQQGASLVASSYNEPLITSEWAVAVFKPAVAAGLRCAYVSNGNATRETLEYIRPYVSAYKIDLKSMSRKGYQQLGGVLQNTLDSIALVHSMGFWLEIVTLVIPGFNDSEAELTEAARYLASISPDIPWHVTAFHKDYKMTDPDNTTAAGLVRAAEIGRAAGLRYVYAGNLPGQVGPYEDTGCPACGERLIGRHGYVILSYNLTPQGRCPKCATPVPGIWPGEPAEVRRGSAADLYRRAPRPARRFRSDVAERGAN